MDLIFFLLSTKIIPKRKIVPHDKGRIHSRFSITYLSPSNHVQISPVFPLALPLVLLGFAFQKSCSVFYLTPGKSRGNIPDIQSPRHILCIYRPLLPSYLFSPTYIRFQKNTWFLIFGDISTL